MQRVLGDRELHRHPAQGEGLHGEHVEGRGVEQQVLARPSGWKSAVGARRAPGDGALLLGGTGEGVGSPGQLGDGRVRSLAVRHGHDARTVGVGEARLHALEDELLGRPAGVDVLVQHNATGVDQGRGRDDRPYSPAPSEVWMVATPGVRRVLGPSGLRVATTGRSRAARDHLGSADRDRTRLLRRRLLWPRLRRG